MQAWRFAHFGGCFPKLFGPWGVSGCCLRPHQQNPRLAANRRAGIEAMSFAIFAGNRPCREQIKPYLAAYIKLSD